jgi:hypothetical protein
VTRGLTEGSAPTRSPQLLEMSLAQYHLPRAKPPKAISPIKTMIRPIQKLHTKIRTIPTITMMPPSDMPAIPRRSSDPANAFAPPRRLSLPHHFSTPCELAQPWGPASTSHRLPAPGSCARVLPETPTLHPMDAERSGRPGEHLRTDSELQKTYSGRPSFRCERRSFDRSCVRSLAWLGLSDTGFPGRRSALLARRLDPTEFAAFLEKRSRRGS